MLKRITDAGAYLLMAAMALFLGWVLYENFLYFLNHCPSRDVLSWDANLRFTYVLDQYRDFAQGRIFRGLLPFFDSPTWPPLRALLALILFALIPGGPDTVVDVGIGTFFFAALLFSLPIAAAKMSGSRIRGAVVWIFVSLLLFYGREIPAYGLSSMLETQGMFFMLWTLYFLYRLNGHFHPSRTGGGSFLTGIPGSGSASVSKLGSASGIGLSIPRSLAWGLFLSSQGLFHTKYPYGLMLMIALGALEVFASPLTILRALLFSLREHYRGVRRAILILLFAILLLLVFGRHLSGINLDTKLFKNFIYLILLILFVDLNIFIYKRGSALRALLPPTLPPLYFLVFFPSLAWLLLHPDRIMSTVGTQLHVQEQARSFFVSLYTAVFDPSAGRVVAGLSLLALLTVALFLYFRGRSDAKESILPNGGEEPLSFLAGYPRILLFLKRCEGILRAPPVYATLVILFQFLILELLTGNKQLRHIYHLLPSLLLIFSLWVLSIPEIFAGAGEHRSGEAGSGAPGRAGRGLAFLLLFLPLLWAGEKIASPLSPAGKLYGESRELCYTGKKPADFEAARWVASQIEPGHRYILINLFHNQGAPPEGWRLASEIDLLLRMRAGDGDLRNDSSYRWKRWDEFDHLLLVSPRCGDAGAEGLAEKRALQTGSKIEKESEAARPSGGFCITRYRIDPR